MLKYIKQLYMEIRWFKLRCKVMYLHKKSPKKARKNINKVL